MSTRVSASTAAVTRKETPQNLTLLISAPATLPRCGRVRGPAHSDGRVRVPKTHSSAPEDAGRANGQGQQQKPKGDGWCPGRPVKCRGGAFGYADQHRSGQHTGKTRHSAENADGKDAADIVAADRRLD